MSAKQRHQCPNCGYEYELWVEICPDCGVLIETVDETDGRSAKGALDMFGPGDDPHWKVVTNVPNAIIGSLIKSQLEDSGIPVLMRRSPSADIAQFSGNDYVPQDVLVPESMEDDARRLLDSSPDSGIGAPYWGSSYGSDSYSVWDEDIDDSRESELDRLRSLWGTNPGSGAESGSAGGLPEGWTLLPTERDVRARTQHQRTHGDDSWHLQGQEPVTNVSPADEPSPRDTSEWQGRSGYEYGRPSLPRLQKIERSDYDQEGWSGNAKWVRICYGILLLALSLPFLFQLLEQLFSIFR